MKYWPGMKEWWTSLPVLASKSPEMQALKQDLFAEFDDWEASTKIAHEALQQLSSELAKHGDPQLSTADAFKLRRVFRLPWPDPTNGEVTRFLLEYASDTVLQTSDEKMAAACSAVLMEKTSIFPEIGEEAFTQATPNTLLVLPFHRGTSAF